MLAPLRILVTRWTLSFAGYPAEITASRLRGACLIRYRRAVCPEARLDDDCSSCPLLEGCSYGQVFAARPVAFTALSGNRRVPRPYLFRPDLRLKDTFTLTLVGEAAALLPRFVRVFEQLGTRGLGPAGPPFTVASVERLGGGEATRLETGEQAQAGSVDEWVATRPPSPRARLCFLSPTSVRDQERWVDGPEPGPTVRRLRDRLSALAAAWCGASPAWDFRRLGEAADGIRLERDDTRWERRERRSGRSQEVYPMSGFSGCAVWSDIPAEIWPLLVAGELLGVGRGCVFGNGWYRLEDAGPKS